jgi:hypothetical protein
MTKVKFFSGMLLGVMLATAAMVSVDLRAQPKGKEPELKVVVPVDLPKSPPAGPKDDALYVWQQPERGYQSVIILKATAPDRLECGLLVPITLRLKDIEAVPGREQDIMKALGDEAVGRLMTAALAGRVEDGSTYADFWAGKERGWLSDSMLKSGLYRKKQVVIPPAKK